MNAYLFFLRAYSYRVVLICSCRVWLVFLFFDFVFSLRFDPLQDRLALSAESLGKSIILIFAIFSILRKSYATVNARK